MRGFFRIVLSFVSSCSMIVSPCPLLLALEPPKVASVWNQVW